MGRDGYNFASKFPKEKFARESIEFVKRLMYPTHSEDDLGGK